MSKTKFAVISGTAGSCSDRCMTGGYGSLYEGGDLLDALPGTRSRFNASCAAGSRRSK